MLIRTHIWASSYLIWSCYEADLCRSEAGCSIGVPDLQNDGGAHQAANPVVRSGENLHLALLPAGAAHVEWIEDVM